MHDNNIKDALNIEIYTDLLLLSGKNLKSHDNNYLNGDSHGKRTFTHYTNFDDFVSARFDDHKRMS